MQTAECSLVGRLSLNNCPLEDGFAPTTATQTTQCLAGHVATDFSNGHVRLFVSTATRFTG